MRVLGLDWATEASRRAGVVLEKVRSGLRLLEVHDGVTDEQTLSFLADERLDVIGVDTPFGWPRAAVEFLQRLSVLEASPLPPSGRVFSDRLTDRIVKDEFGKQPLSVSSDRIALCTLSWLRVAARAQLSGRVDVGQGGVTRPVFEAYPGAALQQFSRWLGFSGKDFKKRRAARREALQALFEHFELEDPGGRFERLVGEDDEASDVADAFLAACNALAFAQALPGWGVRRPTLDELELARTEGWMFVPVPVAAVRSPRRARS